LRCFATGVYAFLSHLWLAFFSIRPWTILTTKLNLASDPFRNRALPWTVTTVVAVASIIALLFIGKSTIQTNAQVLATQRDVTNLRKQTDALNRSAEEIKTALTPEQRRALKSAHALVDRKRFSWSRLFADLESALPGNVRVARIVVKEVNSQGDRTVANLDLTVVSKDPATITQMILDMEREGVFQAELISQNLKRGRGETGTEYEMNVRYLPRAGAPIEAAERSSRPVGTVTGNGRMH
jgi:Tfp pilus assembly protein PilN